MTAVGDATRLLAAMHCAIDPLITVIQTSRDPDELRRLRDEIRPLRRVLENLELMADLHHDELVRDRAWSDQSRVNS